MLYLFGAFAEVNDDLALDRFIVHIDIKMLGLFFARYLHRAPSFAHIKDDGRFGSATEQPRLLRTPIRPAQGVSR